ncbi:hypothetical protein DFH27DRAFT_581667 [Peziza echinospora]|nr:hypothetical protein DFH27DRAFT_581667 [Peziza echinospora]
MPPTPRWKPGSARRQPLPRLNRLRPLLRGKSQRSAAGSGCPIVRRAATGLAYTTGMRHMSTAKVPSTNTTGRTIPMIQSSPGCVMIGQSARILMAGRHAVRCRSLRRWRSVMLGPLQPQRTPMMMLGPPQPQRTPMTGQAIISIGRSYGRKMSTTRVAILQPPARITTTSEAIFHASPCIPVPPNLCIPVHFHVHRKSQRGHRTVLVFFFSAFLFLFYLFHFFCMAVVDCHTHASFLKIYVGFMFHISSINFDYSSSLLHVPCLAKSCILPH